MLRADGGALVAVGGAAAGAVGDELGAVRLPTRIDKAVPWLLEVIGSTAR